MPMIRDICVVGAGIMGAGIAEVCADAGFTVTLVDRDDLILTTAKQRIANNVKKYRKHSNYEETTQHIAAIIGRIVFSTELAKSVRDVDLIIEAIVEKLDTKRQLYAQIEQYKRRDAILATNTSSLTLADLSEFLQEKSTFAGLHFFVPVSKMRLLEVVTTAHTPASTLDSLMEFGQKIGKITIKCKDSPGFIANRILIPLLSEVLGLLDRGVASTEDIDLACREGLGFPIGPLAMLDFIGLDTALDIMKGWKEGSSGIPPKSLVILQRLVADGKLGKKSGEGFYKYKSNL